MKESILLQVANYILWSLVLAAFHVCGTGILWEIAAMPENSKPWRVLRLLFVQCTRCSFWDQLLNRLWMRLCAHATVHRGPADNLQINERGPLPSTQIHVHVPSYSEIGKIEEDAPKDNRNNVEGEAEVFEEKEDAFQCSKKTLDSWEAVAFGMNRVIIAIYLLGNALVFVLFFCPLLFHMIKHLSVKVYVIDK